MVNHTCFVSRMLAASKFKSSSKCNARRNNILLTLSLLQQSTYLQILWKNDAKSHYQRSSYSWRARYVALVIPLKNLQIQKVNKMIERNTRIRKKMTRLFIPGIFTSKLNRFASYFTTLSNVSSNQELFVEAIQQKLVRSNKSLCQILANNLLKLKHTKWRCCWRSSLK